MPFNLTSVRIFAHFYTIAQLFPNSGFIRGTLERRSKVIVSSIKALLNVLKILDFGVAQSLERRFCPLDLEQAIGNALSFDSCQLHRSAAVRVGMRKVGIFCLMLPFYCHMNQKVEAARIRISFHYSQKLLFV